MSSSIFSNRFEYLDSNDITYFIESGNGVDVLCMFIRLRKELLVRPTRNQLACSALVRI